MPVFRRCSPRINQTQVFSNKEKKNLKSEMDVKNVIMKQGLKNKIYQLKCTRRKQY